MAECHERIIYMLLLYNTCIHNVIMIEEQLHSLQIYDLYVNCIYIPERFIYFVILLGMNCLM